jgi:hypothetical protein
MTQVECNLNRRAKLLKICHQEKSERRDMDSEPVEEISTSFVLKLRKAQIV